MAEGIVYINGRLVVAQEAALPVADHGFLYGYAIFETMRACRGRLLFLERHMTRLLASAEDLGIPAPTLDELTDACYKVLAANNLKNARLRLTVTRGEQAYPAPVFTGKPGMVITARPYVPLDTAIRPKGYRALVITVGERGGLLVGHKTANYMANAIHVLDETLVSLMDTHQK
ncbi:aminotransferase class IV, partial [Chloroflexota bacterium]